MGGEYVPSVKENMPWRSLRGNFAISHGRRYDSHDRTNYTSEEWYPDRLIIQDREGAEAYPRIFFAEFVAGSDQARKMHWVGLSQVPESVRDVSQMVGRLRRAADGSFAHISEANRAERAQAICNLPPLILQRTVSP